MNTINISNCDNIDCRGVSYLMDYCPLLNTVNLSYPPKMSIGAAAQLDRALINLACNNPSLRNINIIGCNRMSYLVRDYFEIHRPNVNISPMR